MQKRLNISESTWRAWVGVGAPILALVLIVVALAVMAFWSYAREQDRAYAENSGRLVSASLDGRARAQASVALDYANWDAAYQAISVRWDQSWVESSIYSSVADAMVLFQPDSSIRYTWTGDDYANRPDLAPAAVAAAVDIPTLHRLRGAGGARETVGRTYTSIGDDLAIIGLAPITPEDDARRLAPNSIRNDFLALVEILTPAELEQVGTTLDLSNLRFIPVGATPSAGTVTLPVRSADGVNVGTLEWRHLHPGTSMFVRQIWFVVAGLLLIGVLTIFIARRLVDAQIRTMARAQAIEESGRAKAEFLARVSHELRTPLNAVIGYAEIIEEDSEADATRGDARKIIAAARHLNMLLNDIFDQSRIHAGRMELNPEVLPVAGFMAELQGLVLRSAKERGVKITTMLAAGAGYIFADHARLRQCMLNLVGNAIKFAPGGEVTIRARQARENDHDVVIFDVIDDGVGISQAGIGKLFRPFGQVHESLGGEYGGAGLGLSISRDLARAMGGDITVVSEEGKGSTFSLTVPVATAQALRAA